MPVLALATSERIEADDLRHAVLGLDALLRAKRAVARHQDLTDVAALEAIHGRR